MSHADVREYAAQKRLMSGGVRCWDEGEGGRVVAMVERSKSADNNDSPSAGGAEDLCRVQRRTLGSDNGSFIREGENAVLKLGTAQPSLNNASKERLHNDLSKKSRLIKVVRDWTQVGQLDRSLNVWTS